MRASQITVRIGTQRTTHSYIFVIVYAAITVEQIKDACMYEIRNSICCHEEYIRPI